MQHGRVATECEAKLDVSDRRRVGQGQDTTRAGPTVAPWNGSECVGGRGGDVWREEEAASAG
eukprot:3438030-Rhodomonas_salina.1